jgi:holo-[acyl-carrier protein] synthase
MSVLGLGVDIVETARISKTLDQFGDKFLHRVYLPGEITYSQSHRFPALPLAARFAAKEAISKAFGTGIGGPIGWRDMEITKELSGEPKVVLHGGAAALAEKMGVQRVLLSLSHTEHYAAASAVLVGRSVS